MAKNKRLSRDQKRKAKLTQRASHGPPGSSLAYTGNKYKKDEYVPIVFRTERGIHESDVMADRQLADADIRIALEKLIGQLRQGTSPDTEDQGPLTVTIGSGHNEDFIIRNIRRNWEILFEEEGEARRGKETMIGILRTLLGSLEVWGSPGRHSRGYLRFLEGFMKKTGVVLQGFSSSGAPVDGPPEDELLEIGREWCEEKDPAVAKEFHEMAEHRIRAGDTDSVVGVCQELLGEFGRNLSDVITQELSILSLRAQEAIHKRLN